jgi:hypothetical protein
MIYELPTGFGKTKLVIPFILYETIKEITNNNGNNSIVIIVP